MSASIQAAAESGRFRLVPEGGHAGGTWPRGLGGRLGGRGRCAAARAAARRMFNAFEHILGLDKSWDNFVYSFLEVIQLGWVTESIRVRCYPYERKLIEQLCSDRKCTMSDLLRSLVKSEYLRTYGELPYSSAKDMVGIPGNPPKGGHNEDAYAREAALRLIRQLIGLGLERPDEAKPSATSEEALQRLIRLLGT